MECIFCSQNCDKSDNGKETQDKHFEVESEERKQLKEQIRVENRLIKTFFTFLERHLTSVRPLEQNKNELDKLKSVKAVKELREDILSSPLQEEVSACQSCFKTIKSFCDLYHDLNTIQLLLDLQLTILNDALKKCSSQEGHPLTSCAQSDKTLSESDGNKDYDKLSEFRTQLFKKCSNKLRNSYPRVILRKEIVPPESPTITSDPGDQEITSNPSSPCESFQTFEENDNHFMEMESKFLNNTSGRTENVDNNALTEMEKGKDAPVDLTGITNEVKDVKPEQNDSKSQDSLSPSHNLDETGAINEEADLSLPVARRALRQVQKCLNCNKTFSSSEGLSSHWKTCLLNDCVKGEEEAGDDPTRVFVTGTV